MMGNTGNHGPLVTEIQARTGEGKYLVLAKLTLTADGVILQVLGGEKPHLGAVAIAIPYPSLADPDRLSTSTIVIPRLAHKDDQVAKPLAECLAKSLNTPALAVVGLHIAGASREDIEKLVRNAWDATREVLARCEPPSSKAGAVLPNFDG